MSEEIFCKTDHMDFCAPFLILHCRTSHNVCSLVARGFDFPFEREEMGEAANGSFPSGLLMVSPRKEEKQESVPPALTLFFLLFCNKMQC